MPCSNFHIIMMLFDVFLNVSQDLSYLLSHNNIIPYEQCLVTYALLHIVMVLLDVFSNVFKDISYQHYRMYYPCYLETKPKIVIME